MTLVLKPKKDLLLLISHSPKPLHIRRKLRLGRPQKDQNKSPIIRNRSDHRNLRRPPTPDHSVRVWSQHLSVIPTLIGPATTLVPSRDLTSAPLSMDVTRRTCSSTSRLSTISPTRRQRQQHRHIIPTRRRTRRTVPHTIMTAKNFPRRICTYEDFITPPLMTTSSKCAGCTVI